jgi:hypothetical protein
LATSECTLHDARWSGETAAQCNTITVEATYRSGGESEQRSERQNASKASDSH